MPNRSGGIGTKAETGIVRVMRGYGFPGAERIRPKGRLDTGDLILGVPGWAIQAKGGAAAQYSPLATVADYQDATFLQKINAGARWTLLVMARPGYAPARAGYWRAYMPRAQLLDLSLAAAGLTLNVPLIAPDWVELEFWQAMTLMRDAGHGDPFPSTEARAVVLQGWREGRGHARPPSGADRRRRRVTVLAGQG